jgi:hypothetical protein
MGSVVLAKANEGASNQAAFSAPTLNVIHQNASGICTKLRALPRLGVSSKKKKKE